MAERQTQDANPMERAQSGGNDDEKKRRQALLSIRDGIKLLRHSADTKQFYFLDYLLKMAEQEVMDLAARPGKYGS